MHAHIKMIKHIEYKGLIAYMICGGIMRSSYRTNSIKTYRYDPQRHTCKYYKGKKILLQGGCQSVTL